jgi:hypothetical protein
VQIPQHFAGAGVEDDAVFGELQGARPLKAFGVVEEMEAIDRQLCIFGGADEIEAQAAAAGQLAGERRQRELRLLGERRRPGVLNGEHLGFPPKNG